MNQLYVFIINKTLKSSYFKAWVLAQVRHVVTAAGAALASKGLIDGAVNEQLLGLGLSLAGFYLAALDVKIVDGKIKVALNTVPDVSVMEPSSTVTQDNITSYTPPVSVTATVETSELPPLK